MTAVISVSSDATYSVIIPAEEILKSVDLLDIPPRLETSFEVIASWGRSSRKGRPYQNKKGNEGSTATK